MPRRKFWRAVSHCAISLFVTTNLKLQTPSQEFGAAFHLVLKMFPNAECCLFIAQPPLEEGGAATLRQPRL